ncbi:hypothetical protein [Streptomyces sp. NPDC002537]
MIGHTVSLYHRHPFSYREVKELLYERGIQMTYETVRAWCTTFTPGCAGWQPQPRQ